MPRDQVRWKHPAFRPVKLLDKELGFSPDDVTPVSRDITSYPNDCVSPLFRLLASVVSRFCVSKP